MNTNKNHTPLNIVIGKEAERGAVIGYPGCDTHRHSQRHPYARHGFLGTKEVQNIRKAKGFKLSFE